MNDNLLFDIKQCLIDLFSEINLMRKELEQSMEIMTYANFHHNSSHKNLTKEFDISNYQTVKDFLSQKQIFDIDSDFINNLALVFSRQMDQNLVYIQLQNQKIYLYPDIILEKALIFYRDRN